MKTPIRRYRFLPSLICSLALTMTLAGSAHAGDSDDPEGLAYYGDSYNDLVYVIDVDAMALQKVFEAAPGSKPYPVDRTNDEKTYVSTRGVHSVSVINNHDLSQPLYQIPLQHTPRSTTYNPRKGLALVSGGDLPMTSVIRARNDRIKTVVGSGPGWDPAVNTDFGGSNATGHPFWHKGRKFFQLNRVERRIELYNGRGRLLSTLDTPTTVHHLIHAPQTTLGRRARNTYFAVMEGNRELGIPPGILRFKVRHGRRMAITGVVFLTCGECDTSTMGGHHADIDPAGEYIYMGSAEGHMFIIDVRSMEIVKVIDSGKGSGHTRFVPDRGLAVVTNHNDTFVTLVDLETHSWIGNVTVADQCGLPGHKSQGHTTGLSPDQRYFYGAASCDGRIYRIDLDTMLVDHLDLTSALADLGIAPKTGTAYPIQGAAYFWD